MPISSIVVAVGRRVRSRPSAASASNSRSALGEDVGLENLEHEEVVAVPVAVHPVGPMVPLPGTAKPRFAHGIRGAEAAWPGAILAALPT